MVWLNSCAAAGSFASAWLMRSCLCESGLAALVDAARRQQFVDLSRAFLNQLTLRQLITGQRIFGDGPEVAAVFTKRVFEQQRVGVELRLNLFELERLRLRERGVMRAGFTDSGLRPFVIVFELADF